MFNLDAITNGNNKGDNKKWPYRMLIIRPSGSRKTNAVLLTRFICMLKT